MTNQLDNEILQYLLQNDKIDFDAVRNEMKMEKQNQILTEHNKPIWQGKNGRWYTYLPDATKKRGEKLIAKSTKEKIEEEIVKFYSVQEEESKVTFKKMFDRWVQTQSIEVSENTLDKYRADYRRCIKGSEFEEMDIVYINEEVIKKFLIETTKNLKLNRRALTNLAGYIRNTLNSARINKIIADNPFDFVVIKRLYQFCQETEKTAEKRIVSEFEMKRILRMIQVMKVKKGNYLPTYAVNLAIMTGMRVGELSALAWEDISENSIRICRSEKRKRIPGKSPVIEVESTKTGKERMLPMTNEIRDLLNEVKKIQKKKNLKAEYVFEDENGRVHATTISDCVRSISRKAEVPVKSIHHIRRTVSSNLKSMNVPTATVAAMLGHSEEVNNNNYTYDTSNLDYKKEVLSQINQKMVCNQ